MRMPCVVNQLLLMRLILFMAANNSILRTDRHSHRFPNSHFSPPAEITRDCPKQPTSEYSDMVSVWDVANAHLRLPMSFSTDILGLRFAVSFLT